MVRRIKTVPEKVAQSIMITISIFMGIMCLLPLINVLATSLSSPEAILQGRVYLLPVDIGLDAYKKVLTASSFPRSLVFTILLTIAYTVISMIMTILCAYPLSKNGLKGKGLIMVLIVFTMYFDAGIIPSYLVIRDMNLLNKVSALILPSMLSAYNMIIMRNFFASLDQSIIESATIDGCSEVRILTSIVLPLSTAVLATLSLFYAVSRWNAVSDAIFYITDPKLYPLQAVLKEIILSEQASQMDVGQSATLSKTVADAVKAASIVLSTLPILVVYPFAQRYFTEGIHAGWRKGLNYESMA